MRTAGGGVSWRFTFPNEEFLKIDQQPGHLAAAHFLHPQFKFRLAGDVVYLALCHVDQLYEFVVDHLAAARQSC